MKNKTVTIDGHKIEVIKISKGEIGWKDLFIPGDAAEIYPLVESMGISMNDKVILETGNIDNLVIVGKNDAEWAVLRWAKKNKKRVKKLQDIFPINDDRYYVLEDFREELYEIMNMLGKTKSSDYSYQLFDIFENTIINLKKKKKIFKREK